MAYEKYYPGGWQSGPNGGTPITPEALEHMESGIENALPKDGTAEAAQKLANKRYAIVNLDESGVWAGFDGTEDKTIGVMGNLPLKHGGTGGWDAASARANLEITPDNIGAEPYIAGFYGSDAENSAGWYKVCTVHQHDYSDNVLNFMLTSGYGSLYSGIIHVHTRCNKTTTIRVEALKWLVRFGWGESDVAIVTGDNTWSLFVYRRAPQYGRIEVKVLSKTSTNGGLDFALTSNTTPETTAPSGIVATDGGIVATANSLSTVRTLTVGNTGKPFDGSANVGWSLIEIGALPNTGGTGTGKYVFQQGYRVHNANGVSGKTGYVKIAQFVIGGTYIDSPMTLTVSQRHRTMSSLEIRFASAGTTDPTLDYIRASGPINAYLHKSATSTWDLYIEKAEAWDGIDIVDLKMGDNLKLVTVSWTNVLVSSVPSDAVCAVQGGLTLLWQNASPTSEFAAQTITLAEPYSSYDAVLMLFRIAKGEKWVMPVFLFPDEPSYCMAHVTNNVTRRVTANYGNLVTCYDASIATTYGEPYTNNGYCIPYKIYGVRWRA